MYSPVDIYQLKVNYEISRAKCKIYPKSKTKTKEQHHLTSFWCLNRQLRAHPTPCRNVPIANFDTAWKVSKYRVFSGPYFPVFGLNMEYLSVFRPNAGKYGPQKTPYLDTFRAVWAIMMILTKKGTETF